MKKSYSLFKAIILVFIAVFSLNAQEAKVTIEQDSDIDKLLKFKEDIRTQKIYKIQVYHSVDPDKAEREKSNFLNKHTQWPVEIVWNTPNYKVWVGNFADRLEADRALLIIKKDYMNAIIFQPKIEIK